jgi:small subunit ribosomal protein S5
MDRRSKLDSSPQTKTGYEENVLQIDRVARTMKGGRRISFRALVILGDGKGRVGFAVGKGREVALAIEKAKRKAKKQMHNIKIVNGTIPHSISVKFGSAKLILKPAPPGSSIIAGGAVRAVVEAAGIKNIVSKIFGSSNKINNVKATMTALNRLSHDSTSPASPEKK